MGFVKQPENEKNQSHLIEFGKQPIFLPVVMKCLLAMLEQNLSFYCTSHDYLALSEMFYMNTLRFVWVFYICHKLGGWKTKLILSISLDDNWGFLHFKMTVS